MVESCRLKIWVRPRLHKTCQSPRDTLAGQRERRLLDLIIVGKYFSALGVGGRASDLYWLNLWLKLTQVTPRCTVTNCYWARNAACGVLMSSKTAQSLLRLAGALISFFPNKIPNDAVLRWKAGGDVNQKILHLTRLTRGSNSFSSSNLGKRRRVTIKYSLVRTHTHERNIQLKCNTGIKSW